LLGGKFPHICLSKHPDTRGIRVGFLSKLAIEDEDREDISDLSLNFRPSVPGDGATAEPVTVDKFGRGILRILVRPRADLPIHLLNAHLKSKLLTYPAPPGQTRFQPRNEDERARTAGLALLKRTAEAVALRANANKLLEDNAQNALIVLGDMNDGTDAATTQVLQGSGGSEIDTLGFDRPDAGDDARLFNLAPLIPDIRRYSRIYRGKRELIDHIFVSQELLPGQPRRRPIVDSFIEGSLPSVADDPNARRGEPGSDHAPITAFFDL